MIKLPHERTPRTRYLVLDCSKCHLSYYKSADDALLNRPEGGSEVVGEMQRTGVGSYALLTEQGELIEVRAPEHPPRRRGVRRVVVALPCDGVGSPHE